MDQIIIVHGKTDEEDDSDSDDDKYEHEHKHDVVDSNVNDGDDYACTNFSIVDDNSHNYCTSILITTNY